MANAAWPAALPQDVMVEGYAERPPQTAIRTAMGAGPAKVRRRFTAGVRPMTVTIDLTRAQVAILDDFYVNTLAGGALPFDWTHPRTLEAVTFRFDTDSPPDYRPISGQSWTATLSLEILP